MTKQRSNEATKQRSNEATKASKQLGLLCVVVALVGCTDDHPTPSHESDQIKQSLEPRARVGQHEMGEVVYRREMRKGEAGARTIAQAGSLTPALWQRAARPWTYDGPGERYLYDEEVRGSDSTGETVYELIRRENSRFGQVSPTALRPQKLDATATALLGSSANTLVELRLELADFPDWNVPPRISSDWFSPAEVAAVEAERANAKQARAASFNTMSAGLRAHVLSRGGHIVATNHVIGWLTVRLPARDLSQLRARPDVRQILADPSSQVEDCNGGCTMANESRWKLGSGEGGPGGMDSIRINGAAFLSAGYDGISGAPNGRFRAAVIESENFEDESVAFDSYTGGGSRILQRYTCLSGPQTPNCSPISNFVDGTSADHGTMVANVLLGDFTDGQAENLSYGDPCYAFGHCTDWEKASSGVAREAALVFYEADSVGDKVEAYTHAATEYDDIDVINTSHTTGTGSPACDITSQQGPENAAEVAFDEGIFFASSAGNLGGTSCNLGAPQDTPKVFAVNAYDANASACEADFADCNLHTVSHSNGGMTAPLANGRNIAGAITGVDSMGPADSFYQLDDAGSAGEVFETATNGGTSAATPTIAGAAILVKDWQIADGNSWIGSPGRLHTIMLSMADRAYSTTSLKLAGGHYQWGFGRTKLRLNDRSAWNMRTTTRTTTGSSTFMVSSTPFPTGTELLKCVLLEDEDMSHKSTVGDVTLKVTLRQPVGGSCSQSGSQLAVRSDSSYDLKHMVAFRDPSHNLEGVCADVDLTFYQIAGSSITTHTYCYASPNLDSEPN